MGHGRRFFTPLWRTAGVELTPFLSRVQTSESEEQSQVRQVPADMNAMVGLSRQSSHTTMIINDNENDINL